MSFTCLFNLEALRKVISEFDSVIGISNDYGERDKQQAVVLESLTCLRALRVGFRVPHLSLREIKR